MLQSSARIGCFAGNIGAAAGASVALAATLGLGDVSAVPVMVLQWTLAARLSTAVTYFQPPLVPVDLGGNLTQATYAALQIAGAYAVPPVLDVGAAGPHGWNVTAAQMDDWLALYAQGALTGKITPPPPAPPAPPGGCLGQHSSSWYAYVPDWDVRPGANPTSFALVAKAHPSFNCEAGSLLKKCTAKSTSLPAADVKCYAPGAVVHLAAAPRPASVGLLVVKLAAARSPPPPAPATRRQLFAALAKVRAGTAAQAMQAPGPGESGKPVTLVELAHVVTRHAAVLRKVLHAEEVMGVLGLKPYTFHGDV